MIFFSESKILSHLQPIKDGPRIESEGGDVKRPQFKVFLAENGNESAQKLSMPQL